MIHTRNTCREHIRSIVDSTIQKETEVWQKRIAAKDSGICPVVAGAPALSVKGLGSSYSITISRQMVR